MGNLLFGLANHVSTTNKLLRCSVKQNTNNIFVRQNFQNRAMEELDSSELGTQDYWQKAYTKEIENFIEHGNPGDVWFGEDSAERVINWIFGSGVDKDIAIIDLGKSKEQPAQYQSSEWICACGVDKDTAVIDLGCGNGYTLSELAREGFTNLLGIDYCQEAITLAEKVSQSEFPHIKYKVFDITQDSVKELGKFGIVHDKGTYDAIGLNPEDPKRCREKYIDQVVDMLDDEGLFVITSCNWTEEELLKQFSEKLKLKRVIPTPQFKFGGKVGSVVSSVVFTKK